jgi:hypothetical protein
MSFINDNKVVTDISDSQVLSQLRKRRLKLTLEIERVDLAIKAFEEVQLNQNTSLELLAYDSETDEELLNMVDNDLKSLVMYHPKMKHEQKVYWALGQLKEGTAIEIADLIMHQDTTIKHRTAIVNAMSYTCSRLKMWGKIDMVKKGKLNYYRLKS